MELRGRDLAALVAADPGLVPEDFFEPVARNGAAGMEGLDARLEVKINEDFTKVE